MYYQKTTLIKARIQRAVDFLEKKGIKNLNKDDIQSNNIFHITSYQILKLSNPCTLKNDLTRSDTRGRKKIVTVDQIWEIKQILQQEDLKDCELTWKQLGIEEGVEALDQIIKKLMGSLDYHKYLAYQKNW